MPSRFKQLYNEKITPILMSEFKYASVMQAPRLKKIVINCGVGKLSKEKQVVDTIFRHISLIAGQKPVMTKAKKSISGFKIRAGMPVGIKVTLRGDRMYDFLDRLINITLPRTRDFSGISQGILDGSGNASIGMKDYSIFPEVSGEEASASYPLEITMATSAKTDDEAKKLLEKFGFPFKGLK
ncbi:MAG: 50S ribosomal protein L5 [bacterium]